MCLAMVVEVVLVEYSSAHLHAQENARHRSGPYFCYWRQQARVTLELEGDAGPFWWVYSAQMCQPGE